VRNRLAHLLIRALAILLLVAGLIGLVLPIVPGWLLIILGIILLGEESRLGSYLHRRLPERVRRKLATIRARFDKKL